MAELLEVGAVPLFDMIPILQVLPGPDNAVKKDANRLKRETDEFFWKQYLEVKRKIAAGQKTGCWLESSRSRHALGRAVTDVITQSSRTTPITSLKICNLGKRVSCCLALRRPRRMPAIPNQTDC